MIFRPHAAFAAALLLAAPAAAQPVADRGPEIVRPDEENDNLQWAASVVQLNMLQRQGDNIVKLFGAAAGDPAMNGLNTFLAFFVPPPENGWQVFRVGDFLDYRVVAETPGRVLLEVQENTISADGEIGSRARRIAITWRPGPDGAAPDTVTVATAR